MGNSPSIRSDAGDQPGGSSQSPADLSDTDHELTHQEIVTPSPGEAEAGMNVILITIEFNFNFFKLIFVNF